MDNQKERLSAVLAMVDELQQSEGLSQEQVGRKIGVSGAILSQLRSGKYTGVVENQIKKLEDYFSVKTCAEGTYHEIEYAKTSISSKVYNVIKLCHIKGGLAMCAGDAGIGKTKAAKKYAADNPTNCYYIALNPCLTSIKSLLKAISQKIGARPERSLDDMWFSIRSRLTDGTVLIFDEAQHLPYKTIETLRAFSDSFADEGQTLGIKYGGFDEEKANDYAYILCEAANWCRLRDMLSLSGRKDINDIRAVIGVIRSTVSVNTTPKIALRIKAKTSEE